jgi:hypothetical protein
MQSAHALAVSAPRAAAVLAAGLALSLTALAQNPQTPKGTRKYGYAIHQSVDLGGHVADYYGSGAMYDTLVNLQTGPRLLGQTLDMHALPGSKHLLFDQLFTQSTGYGGDPNDYSVLRMSKGKLYEFDGSFRRDRQYFDYNLLDNPLVPAGLTSNGYTFPQVENSPHLFNTVRRMTDGTLTMFPISKLSFHAEYTRDIMEGPTLSSYHQGTDALLQQNWKNTTDTWRMGIRWKALPRTVIRYDQIIERYLGNTSWQLAGLNLQLSDGTPVSLGFDNTSVPSCKDKQSAILSDATNPPTADATCNGFLQYSRTEPIRTLFPTEELSFQSSSIKNVEMNGRLVYTGASSDVSQYNESFSGLETRTGNREITTTGSANARRVSVGVDYGLVWQLASKVSLAEQYDLYDFRIPGNDFYLATSYSGTSMLTSPSATGTQTLTNDSYYLGQKTQENTVTARWNASTRLSLSLGYRYRVRNIRRRSPDTDIIDIHQQGAILGADFQPIRNWKLYGNIELGYADNAYVQTSPRQFQDYQIRTTYQPKEWANFSLSFDDLEQRNNVEYVNHLDHDRALAADVDLSPSQHYGVDLSYGYLDYFSETDECYTISPAPTDAPLTGSPACIANGTPYFSNGYYDSPTQYGSFGLMLSPVQQLRSSVGYRMTAVNGTTATINPREVPGSLQSQYQTPYANVAWTVHPGWAFRASWDYYGYGEGTPIGPTLPRSFHGNLYTLGMHYEF